MGCSLGETCQAGLAPEVWMAQRVSTPGKIPQKRTPHQQNKDKHELFSDSHHGTVTPVIQGGLNTAKRAHTKTIPYLSPPTRTYPIYNCFKTRTVNTSIQQWCFQKYVHLIVQRMLALDPVSAPSKCSVYHCKSDRNKIQYFLRPRTSMIHFKALWQTGVSSRDFLLDRHELATGYM